MSECIIEKKGRAALFVSVGLNIFLLALIVGHAGLRDAPSFMPSWGALPHETSRGERMMPLFRPGDLFSAGDRRADEARMREHFDKMDALRKEFAHRLESGPVSKDDALKHFDEINQLMSGVKKEAQERAAEKIASLSEDERKNMAKSLLARRRPFHMHEHDGGAPAR